MTKWRCRNTRKGKKDILQCIADNIFSGVKSPPAITPYKSTWCHAGRPQGWCAHGNPSAWRTPSVHHRPLWPALPLDWNTGGWGLPLPPPTTDCRCSVPDLRSNLLSESSSSAWQALPSHPQGCQQAGCNHAGEHLVWDFKGHVSIRGILDAMAIRAGTCLACQFSSHKPHVAAEHL